jgi:hypothetical protein
MSTQKSVASIQAEIEQALESLPALVPQLPSALKALALLVPQQGFRVVVSLRHNGDAKKSRQVKSNAPADSWSPEPDEGVWISYDVRPEKDARPEKVADSASETNATAQSPTTTREREMSEASAVTSPHHDLLRALDKAESVTQFVSLKWFRDTFLPQQGHAWAVSPEERHRMLASTIERRWILTSKVANPKNPQFPVTAIRVNRPLPEVRDLLDREASMRSAFTPVTIPGESLSQTVLSERR